MRGLVFVLIALLAFACNGGGESLRTATPGPSPSTTPGATPTATPTPQPTATAAPQREYPPKVSLTERGVYLIRPDGTGLRNLTPGEDSRYRTSWSPDGSRIAVAANGSRRRVSVIDADGAAELTVLDGSGWGREWWIGMPLWSPDGRQLAVPARRYQEGEPYHTFLVDADGSSEPVELFEGFPLGWSPDGESLAFSTHSESGATLSIFDMTTDTATVIDKGTSFGYLDWSPDSERMAYSMYPADTAPEQVVVIDRDGENRRVVAERASHPEWSPDGEYVAFVDSTGCLAVAELASSADPVCLARGQLLRWSPEEDAILIWHKGSLSLVSLATHETIEAADVTGDVVPTGQVSLSPDGQRVTLAGCEPSPPAPCPYPGDLFVANADGTGLEKLVRPSTGIPWGPEWSPDGRYIAFVDGRTQIS